MTSKGSQPFSILQLFLRLCLWLPLLTFVTSASPDFPSFDDKQQNLEKRQVNTSSLSFSSLLSALGATLTKLDPYGSLGTAKGAIKPAADPISSVAIPKSSLGGLIPPIISIAADAFTPARLGASQPSDSAPTPSSDAPLVFSFLPKAGVVPSAASTPPKGFQLPTFLTTPSTATYGSGAARPSDLALSFSRPTPMKTPTRPTSGIVLPTFLSQVSPTNSESSLLPSPSQGTEVPVEDTSFVDTPAQGTLSEAFPSKVPPTEITEVEEQPPFTSPVVGASAQEDQEEESLPEPMSSPPSIDPTVIGTPAQETPYDVLPGDQPPAVVTPGEKPPSIQSFQPAPGPVIRPTTAKPPRPLQTPGDGSSSIVNLPPKLSSDPIDVSGSKTESIIYFGGTPMSLPPFIMTFMPSGTRSPLTLPSVLAPPVANSTSIASGDEEPSPTPVQSEPADLPAPVEPSTIVSIWSGSPENLLETHTEVFTNPAPSSVVSPQPDGTLEETPDDAPVSAFSDQFASQQLSLLLSTILGALNASPSSTSISFGVPSPQIFTFPPAGTPESASSSGSASSEWPGLTSIPPSPTPPKRTPAPSIFSIPSGIGRPPSPVPIPKVSFGSRLPPRFSSFPSRVGSPPFSVVPSGVGPPPVSSVPSGVGPPPVSSIPSGVSPPPLSSITSVVGSPPLSDVPSGVNQPPSPYTDPDEWPASTTKATDSSSPVASATSAPIIYTQPYEKPKPALTSSNTDELPSYLSTHSTPPVIYTFPSVGASKTTLVSSAATSQGSLPTREPEVVSESPPLSPTTAEPAEFPSSSLVIGSIAEPEITPEPTPENSTSSPSEAQSEPESVSFDSTIPEALPEQSDALPPVPTPSEVGEPDFTSPRPESPQTISEETSSIVPFVDYTSVESQPPTPFPSGTEPSVTPPRPHTPEPNQESSVLPTQLSSETEAEVTPPRPPLSEPTLEPLSSPFSEEPEVTPPRPPIPDETIPLRRPANSSSISTPPPSTTTTSLVSTYPTLVTVGTPLGATSRISILEPGQRPSATGNGGLVPVMQTSSLVPVASQPSAYPWRIYGDPPFTAGAIIPLPRRTGFRCPSRTYDNWGNCPASDRKVVVIPYSRNEQDDVSWYFMEGMKAANNGGMMLLEAGRVYVIGQALDLTFLNDVYIQIDGEVRFTADMNYWQNNSFWHKLHNTLSFWVWGGRNIKIFGQGTINGQGQTWYDAYAYYTNGTPPANPQTLVFPRPALFTVDNATNMEVYGLQFYNSPGWSMFVSRTRSMFFDHVRVSAFSNSRAAPVGTDAFATANVEGITVTNAVVNAYGSDCFSAKTNTTNIVVHDVVCNGTSGISFGDAVGQTPGEINYIANAYVYNVTLYGGSDGLVLRTWAGPNVGPGYLRNITFEDIEVQNVLRPIVIDTCFPMGDARTCEAYPSNAGISGINYWGVWGTSSGGRGNVVGELRCSSRAPCDRIDMKGVEIWTPLSGREPGFVTCENVANPQATQLQCVGPTQVAGRKRMRRRTV